MVEFSLGVQQISDFLITGAGPSKYKPEDRSVVAFWRCFIDLSMEMFDMGDDARISPLDMTSLNI